MKYFWNNFASLTKLLTIHRVSRSRVLIIRVKQRVRCKQHVGHWIDQGVGRRQSVDYRPTIGRLSISYHWRYISVKKLFLCFIGILTYHKCSFTFPQTKQQSISFSAVNILLSITAFLGNSLILSALHNESSLHPPSKLLYRCLATINSLVGLVVQPLSANYRMSLVHEHWSFCRYARDAIVISSYVLCGVSLMKMTALSVDRLLAMLLGLRYKEIVTLRRTYIILAILWVVCLVTGLFLSQLPYRPLVAHHNYAIWPGNLSHLVHRDFPRSRSSSGSNTRSWRDTERRCTMHCGCS